MAESKPLYQDLGIFSDWVNEARRQQSLFPMAEPGPEIQRRVREVLGFASGPEMPLDVRIDATWERDGLAGESISWSVGYGPRTEAWLIKPAGARGQTAGHRRAARSRRVQMVRQGEDRAGAGRSAAPSGWLLGMALRRARLCECAGA